MLESDSSRRIKPRVSVVIPVRSGMPYLEETLLSVRRQTRRADEVIVVDNCSIDGTREFLVTQQDIRLITQPRGVTASANWTAAVQAATGDFVIVLCADDVLLPSCLKGQLDALLSHGDCVMA